jgi:hypothetical protein
MQLLEYEYDGDTNQLWALFTYCNQKSAIQADRVGNERWIISSLV